MPRPEEQKRIVGRFLQRANRYADDRLQNYKSELAQASGMQALALTDKISHWTAYRAFNEHALTELDQGLLDDWFEPD